MATITKLPSGSWRVQVRRKGKYASETFLRRGDGEAWARDIELKIDRGEPILCDTASTKTFGGLIDLHKSDLAQVGKTFGRSKTASLESRPAAGSGKAMTAVTQDSYIQGVLARAVDSLVKALGMGGVSKSQVSRLCAEIDGRAQAFVERPLEDA